MVGNTNVTFLNDTVLSGESHAHNNFGAALFDQRRVVEAIRHYQMAIELAPEYTHPYNNLGNALLFQGNVTEAIRVYQKAIEIDPEYAVAYHNIGYALYAKKDLGGAITHYRMALKFDPNFGDAHMHLSLALHDLQDLDGPIAHCLRASQLDASNSARLRRKVLIWLRADVGPRSELPRTGQADGVAFAIDKLAHWKNYPELAGVRAVRALAALPAEEGKDWQMFWDDVDERLRQLRASPISIVPPR